MNGDGDIDYSRYSYRELLEALDTINARKYPENYSNLQAAIEDVGPSQKEALAQASVPERNPDAESYDDDFQSDPDVRRVKHLATAVVVAGVSAYLLWVDDLTLPMDKPLKISLSGIGETLGYLAFLFAIAVPASFVLDYADHRDNGKKYLLFAVFAESIATGLLVFASVIGTSTIY